MNRSLTSLIALCALLPSLGACSADKNPDDPALANGIEVIGENAAARKVAQAEAVNTLFNGPEFGETRALVVMRGNTVITERYADGYGKDTRFISWSMAKTVTAVMIGMLVADGRLKLDQTPPIPSWQRPGDPRGNITLRQLLQMRSGLDHTEGGDPIYQSDEVRMLFLDGRDDMAAYAEAKPLEAEAGSRFEYSTATTIILADIAAHALTDSKDPETRRQAVDMFLKARIFTPLGMTSAEAEYDAHGTLIGGSMIHATARDWGRFGEFLRNKGSYLGSQLVPRKWVELMTSPSPKSPQYGFQIWLNRPYKLEEGETHPLFPDKAPRNVFAMIGHMGQYVIMAPDRGITLVRLGHSDADERKALMPKLAGIMALY